MTFRKLKAKLESRLDKARFANMKTKQMEVSGQGQNGASQRTSTMPFGNPEAQELKSFITQRNATDSPLLRVYPELRNHIYKYVLGEKSICLTSREGQPRGEICANSPALHAGYHSEDQETGVLSILLVCVQIHSEAGSLCFAINVFRYSSTLLHLEAWQLGKPDALSVITAVRLYSNGHGNESAWLEGLKYFPSLKYVEVAVDPDVEFMGAPRYDENLKISYERWERETEALAGRFALTEPRVRFYKHDLREEGDAGSPG